MAKEDNKKTVFRRIGGRIVPITMIASGSAMLSKKFNKYTSKKMDKVFEKTGGGKFGQRKLNFFSGQNVIDKENARYNKILTKASGGSFFGGDGRFDPLTKREGKIEFGPRKYRTWPTEGSSFGKAYIGRMDTQGINKIIRTNIKNTPVMLHELGHIKQSGMYQKSRNDWLYNKTWKKLQKFYEGHMTKYWQNRNRGKYFQALANDSKSKVLIGEIKQRTKYYSKHVYHKTAMNISGFPLGFRPFLREVDADLYAIKKAKQLRGPKFARITAKAMIPNILGYARKPTIKMAGALLIASGTGLLVNSLRKK